MRRRTFLHTVIGAFIFAPSLLMAAETLDYSPGLIQSKLDAGHSVLVDYAAVWCSTCKQQARVIDQLREENPEYNSKIIFVKVDWDTYRSKEVTTSRNIPRRSTLIMLKGSDELGRIVAGTNKKKIKSLLDSAL